MAGTSGKANRWQCEELCANQCNQRDWIKGAMLKAKVTDCMALGVTRGEVSSGTGTSATDGASTSGTLRLDFET